MKRDIVLIGPPMAGKSTLAKLTAEELRLPLFSLDELRFQYMKEIGYDKDLDDEIRAKGGFLARALYWQLFGAYTVERFLAENEGGVLDFGGGHTVFDNDEANERIKRALSPYPNIFLILPAPDIKKSHSILSERLAREPVELNFDFIAYFLQHPANYEIAKHTIYTNGRSAIECKDLIIDLADYGGKKS
jgi:hypothetical protein